MFLMYGEVQLAKIMQKIDIPYNGNSPRKKMFANFANLRVFANIFLLNFHFLVLFTSAQK